MPSRRAAPQSLEERWGTCTIRSEERWGTCSIRREERWGTCTIRKEERWGTCTILKSSGRSLQHGAFSAGGRYKVLRNASHGGAQDLLAAPQRARLGSSALIPAAMRPPPVVVRLFSQELLVLQGSGGLGSGLYVRFRLKVRRVCGKEQRGICYATRETRHKVRAHSCQ